MKIYIITRENTIHNTHKIVAAMTHKSDAERYIDINDNFEHLSYSYQSVELQTFDSETNIDSYIDSTL
jgi:hypothetical protein